MTGASSAAMPINTTVRYAANAFPPACTRDELDAGKQADREAYNDAMATYARRAAARTAPLFKSAPWRPNSRRCRERPIVLDWNL